MAWIETVAYENATGRLKQLYDRVKGPGDNIDNIMMMHSLRPHSMEGHMTLYKYVLHHTGNRVPKWFLETLGVHVSMLNKCDYCVEHHFAGLRRLLGDDSRSDALRAALESGDYGEVFDARQASAIVYATALTADPHSVTESLVKDMCNAGWDDGEILEINQVTAYFAYANRTVIGLGCSTDGDILGLSPNQSEDPDNWSHT